MIDVILPVFLAFYVAWNLGANDVANSMGTSVGSQAISLKQAIAIAGILEFTGAVVFGGKVSETLATDLIHLEKFGADLHLLFLGMVSVLLSCGIWLQVATRWGLPVASSHAVVGAIAGFTTVAIGPGAINWSSIGQISLIWLITPLVSGSLAYGFYSSLRQGILDYSQPWLRLQEWIPWISMGLFTIFGALVFPTVWETFPIFPIPSHTAAIATGAIAAFSLTVITWYRFTPEKNVETLFAQFQLLSACFVAFAHGSNDVGNAIAPLAVIVQIQQGSRLDSLAVPLWILMIGAIGIVSGLAVWGKNVIATIGETLTPLKPSGGFCAELATAATILLASRLGFPVSTSHSLVGAVVGIGLVQRHKDSQPLNLRTLGEIGFAWVITLPLTAILSATILTTARLLGG